MSSFMIENVMTSDRPYNTKECAFDGGDWKRNPVTKYPGCDVCYEQPSLIVDGRCDDGVHNQYDGSLWPVDSIEEIAIHD
eukprot:CAMPEP_0204637592 /NCGR_PEP_ID=MMETSP0717-20131115/37070_1 /ASSEMBLY_ACC=CAM_ASM_000666 /TAXON_ID=230516 /ORGANISM="Chaetoceros curvisetus" /LENGTH=79 /DNA_ID=CAMNT_0051657057 /DNA_START=65 /DNA_END=304 /DNA_ORIENTATION=-